MRASNEVKRFTTASASIATARRTKPGSLPTSLRFASGQFKNGNDPYSLYQTLTHGFGQMPPQTWMVPSQKYDVIHYIRETFLKTRQPDPVRLVDRAYLTASERHDARPGRRRSSLVGDGLRPDAHGHLRGERRRNELRLQGNRRASRRGPGRRLSGPHWIRFRPRHDALGGLRGAAKASLTGTVINFNGRHEIHPRVVGLVELANPVGPGWANPQTGSFDDPRLAGTRRPALRPAAPLVGPFPGQYRHGDQVVLAYTVGNTDVLEMPGVETEGRRLVVFTPDVRTSVPAIAQWCCRSPGGPDRSSTTPFLKSGGDASRSVALARARLLFTLQGLPSTDKRTASTTDAPFGILAASSPIYPGAVWSEQPRATCDSRSPPAMIRSVSRSGSAHPSNGRRAGTGLGRSRTVRVADSPSSLTADRLDGPRS